MLFCKKAILIFFISHPIQYISPLLKELSKKIPLIVYYYADTNNKDAKDIGFGKKIEWDIPLLEGYSYQFLPNWCIAKPIRNRLMDVFNPSVIKILWQTSDKIIVLNGWAYSSDLLVIIFSKLFGKKVWMRGDNPLNQELRKSKKIRFIKKLLLTPFFYFLIDKFLYVGKQNKLFFQYYGVRESKLTFAPHVIDNDYFGLEFSKLKGQKQKIKNDLNIPEDKKVILFVGKFITEKQPLDLLRSYVLLPNNRYCLLFVGEGALRKEMQNFIAVNKLANVFLTGFINQTEIAKYYAIADVFVMSSISETWGLSVNEAMNFALPIIVSSTCGCCDDLVKNGKNGFLYKEGDIKELAQWLEIILEDSDLRKKMGNCSLEHIKNYSIPIITQNIIAVI